MSIFAIIVVFSFSPLSHFMLGLPVKLKSVPPRVLLQKRKLKKKIYSCSSRHSAPDKGTKKSESESHADDEMVLLSPMTSSVRKVVSCGSIADDHIARCRTVPPSLARLLVTSRFSGSNGVSSENESGVGRVSGYLRFL